MSASKWKPFSDSFKEAIDYINGRKEGRIKSFQTPLKKLNEAGIDGFEWNNIVVIGGRPASGKTMLKDQIIQDSFGINENDYRVLEFSLEMVGRVSAIRQATTIIKKSYKYLLSIFDKSSGYGGVGVLSETISQMEIDRIKHNFESRKGMPIDIVEDPPTVEEFEEIIDSYMEHYRKSDGSYTKTVITLDHSVLLKKSRHHGNKTDMLYDLGEVATKLKKKYPILFIILSQLGRGVDTPERNKDGSLGNYIVTSDLFGGDALIQHADIVIGLDNPIKRNIKIYGTMRHIIDDDKWIVCSFLKSRNGGLGMAFFRANYENFRLEETARVPDIDN